MNGNGWTLVLFEGLVIVPCFLLVGRGIHYRIRYASFDVPDRPADVGQNGMDTYKLHVFDGNFESSLFSNTAILVASCAFLGLRR